MLDLFCPPLPIVIARHYVKLELASGGVCIKVICPLSWGGSETEWILSFWWQPYWPTGGLADNQKMRNLANNLSKMSNKIYSEAVIGQFKTLFCKRTDIP